MWHMKTKLAVLALISLLVFVSDAAADSIGSGKTTLMLAGTFDRQTKANEINIQAIHHRPGKTRTVTMAIASGSLSSAARGYLSYKTGLRFGSGDRGVLFRKLNLDTDHASLNGSFGRREISIATVAVGRVWRDGFAIGFRCDLRLGRGAAEILNSQLRPTQPFRPGQRLGRATTVARPTTVSVTGGSLELALAEPFSAKLEALGVGTRAYEAGAQTAASPMTFALPLEQGLVSPDLASGGAFTEGGLQFNRGEDLSLRQVGFSGLWMNLESGLLQGSLQSQEGSFFGTTTLAGLDLGAAARTADPTGGALQLTGVTATLGPDLAAALNRAFVSPESWQSFSTGEPFASLGATIQSR